MTDDAHAPAATDTFVDAAEGAPDELETLRAENAQLREQTLRYAAEAENTRRRAEKDTNDARAFAIQRFARDLFGVADNLSRALQFAPREVAEPAVRTFVLGVELTDKALAEALERNGLKRLEPAPGVRFDPHQHQAMTEQAAEGVAPGAVVQTLQAGYELFGRTLRPAMVVVAPRSGVSAAQATPEQAEAAEARAAYASPEAEDSGRTYDGRA